MVLAVLSSPELIWLTLADGRAAPQTFSLIEVRSPDAFAAAHIPGARNIALDLLAMQVKGLPANLQAVAVCGKSGERSQAAVLLLRKMRRDDALWLCGDLGRILKDETARGAGADCRCSCPFSTTDGCSTPRCCGKR